MPKSAGRPLKPRARPPRPALPRAIEMAITPARLTRIPASAQALNGSDKMTMPKTAACTVSVLEKVVPTAKLRSEKSDTRSAVATIWAPPPTMA